MATGHGGVAGRGCQAWTHGYSHRSVGVGIGPRNREIAVALTRGAS